MNPAREQEISSIQLCRSDPRLDSQPRRACHLELNRLPGLLLHHLRAGGHALAI
jgi:hypothetical protein